jgi:hypothetical protein
MDENQKIFTGKSVAEIDEILAAGQAERNKVTAVYLDSIRPGMKPEDMARVQSEIVRILKGGQ